MHILTIIVIAIGLSFDTFAVSVSSGVILPKITFYEGIRIAIVLAIFQALMPLIGWGMGKGIVTYAKNLDHWIAFVLLSGLGVKMIYESFSKDVAEKLNPLQMKVRVGMAIATSIDALIVGFSFAFLEYRIIMSTFIIGSVTFLVSMLGLLFGKKVGERLGKRMEIIGGIILIAIGLKILIEHTLFA
ncbi:MAG: manganese efflux pump [Bacteroidetes bacterium]|nr:manganese efflux pump [Bacteroidota bacterium]